MSTVRACAIERLPRRRGTRRAPGRSRRPAGVSTCLWPGSAATSTSSRSSPSCALRPRERARRGRGAAGRTHRRRGRGRITASGKLELLLADLDGRARLRAGCAQGALELLGSGGGVPSTRKPRSVRRSRHGRAFGCGPVDEEVGQRRLVPAPPAPARGRARRAARRKSSIPAPVAHESRNTATIALVVDRRTRGSGSRSILFRTTICGSSSRPAPYAASSASIVRHCSSAACDASITCTSIRARSRCARNSCPRPIAFARALDQPRHVGDDELAAVRRLDRAEHRLQRRERVVGDLRLRVRDAREQRRLAGVRQPDQRRVGEQLQVELDLELVAGRADLGEPRHLPGRGDEARVAAAAAAAAREHDARARGARGRRSARRRRSAPACRPARAARRRRRARRACGRRARSRRVRACDPPAALVAERSRSPASATQHDVAAVAAVAAVGPALRHVLLAPEAETRRRRPCPACTWIVARSLNIQVTVGYLAGAAATYACGLDDRHEAALAARAERDRALADGEDRVVAAELRAGAGAELRAALADDDVARADRPGRRTSSRRGYFGLESRPFFEEPRPFLCAI